ncbi:DEAD/DEAH box helicase [Dietzia sp. HMSC21D01]|uniref:ATP-dependent RNA helicase DeaD n=5 Tax=Dietzia cinnamea TaxID=321318 RepID=A0AAW5QD88_9ACTN|nr:MULTISPECIES: DEAD/DEAH box helicase [Dietzia]EFV91110.1 ATP-dependent DEAD-box RNA helicase DeaD [Dietzia cinnamea P4]PWD95271.1 ATP-dependent RNA helicase [Dietzia maris]MBM7229378.1 DEAD/DEAH box helicase [Dietzia cinnamea]MCT1865312.1 DEAD/DEAH box helicase [Dietzia cinnamea]MCT2034782.1 DEAD/DEAH box helicase [Dietzia cinnamea]
MDNNDEDRTATAGDEVDTDASTPETPVAAPAGSRDDAPHDEAPAEDAAVTFADMGLAPAVAKAVRDVGYEVPSAIQAATIPLVLEGRDVVGLAQTGTGKTAAFALPILSLIDPSVKSPQALILAPTRELALQVAEACVTYSAGMPQVNVLPIYGGQAYGIQLSGLRRGAQIIVGTPGRVIDHLKKGTLDLSGLRHLVLDEADEMLAMGFQEDVERILSDTPESTQVALFSATMPSAIRRISQKYLTDPTEVKVASKTSTAPTIQQRYVLVNHRDKLDALTRILEVEDFDAMIMFVRTKSATEELAERLRARGFSAAPINGDIPQNLRERTIEALKDGRTDILVATDVAARGLDVPRISHVVNYDIPHDTESYIHRIGRTGRAGRSGHALLFVTPRERRLLSQIERATRQPLTEVQLPSVDDVNEMRMAKFAQSITESLDDPNIALFRRLVEEYASEHSVSMADIAAALATQSRNSDEFLMREPERPQRRERQDDRGGDRRDRPARNFSDGPRPSRSGKDMAQYRIAVGKRNNVKPGSIMGALANEAGLSGGDIGRISIRFDHSIVELPAGLPSDQLESMKGIRVGGAEIDIRPDSGAPAGRPSSFRDDRGGKPRGGGHRRDDRGDRGGYSDRRGERHGDRRDDRRDNRRDDRGGFRRGDDDRRGGGGFRGRSGGGQDRY